LWLSVVDCIDNQSNVVVGSPMLVVECIDHQLNIFVGCLLLVVLMTNPIVDNCG
jgi:hypothetical protein